MSEFTMQLKHPLTEEEMDITRRSSHDILFHHLRHTTAKGQTKI